MSIEMILLPVFVQVALTFVMLFWMARSRVAAVKSKQVKMADIALGQLNWPTKVQQISNSYHSQLQLPVLFVVLAWIFVLSRLAHAYIHATSNYVPNRFNAFAVGVFTLLAMWIIFAARIVLSA